MLPDEQAPSRVRARAWLSPQIEMPFASLFFKRNSSDLSSRVTSSGTGRRSCHRAWAGVPAGLPTGPTTWEELRFQSSTRTVGSNERVSAVTGWDLHLKTTSLPASWMESQ